MNRTILYIEDNPDNMMLIERTVESLDCQLLWAANGATGLALAQTQRPDLILLDINLPDVDGYEIARQLRAWGRDGDDFFRDVPIIAVTANALKGDADKAISAGCNAHVAKPINTRELRSRLAAVLARTGPLPAG